MIDSTLTILKDFGPVATIALALVIIFILVRQKSVAGYFNSKNEKGEEISLISLDEKITLLSENHFHDVSNQLKSIEKSLNRIEYSLRETGRDIAYIKYKTNGK